MSTTTPGSEAGDEGSPLAAGAPDGPAGAAHPARTDPAKR